MKNFQWILRIVIVVILVQTLPYKFLADPSSVHIFMALGIEPWGRYLSGIAEAVASMLLIYNGTVAVGAMLSAAIMTGAMLSHTVLGIDVQGDGGLLFYLALTVFLASMALIYLQLPKVKQLVNQVCSRLF